MSDLFAYKVLTAEQFDQFKAEGVFKGAPVDLADGYIHMSTRAQAAETVAKHFAGQDRLVLLMIDLAPFGDAVKWEVSRGGALSRCSTASFTSTASHCRLNRCCSGRRPTIPSG